MRAGVSSTALFFSITLPDTGQYSSLAALTLSSAPHSPVKHYYYYYCYYYLLQLSFHLVAVVLTLVQTKQNNTIHSKY